ncbi:hypothetical protein OIU85_018987 [Salix viminalis]|uniref:Uncharacterized protein n=1 Tax=Salix viminalis TaxID=40686 RepID=A0A9Q0ZJQ9_SALVM|nr:hypothetical protein OIU85_018987 [Salix viminalis]
MDITLKTCHPWFSATLVFLSSTKYQLLEIQTAMKHPKVHRMKNTDLPGKSGGAELRGRFGAVQAAGENTAMEWWGMHGGSGLYSKRWSNFCNTEVTGVYLRTRPGVGRSESFFSSSSPWLQPLASSSPS